MSKKKIVETEEKEEVKVEEGGNTPPIPSGEGIIKVSITKEELAKLEEQSRLADEYLDHLRRFKAEFENYKKRQERERIEFIKLAAEGLITDLLSVLDSFDWALMGVQKSHSLESFLPGVELIRKQLGDVLVKNGLGTIKSIGKPFDPNVHEALMHLESDKYPEDTVTQEVRKGYVLNNKVIRPAQVAVSKKGKE
ncbi:MAG: nucleotide exchange factor GrpE [Nitrospirota bacterium]